MIYFPLSFRTFVILEIAAISSSLVADAASIRGLQIENNPSSSAFGRELVDGKDSPMDDDPCQDKPQEEELIMDAFSCGVKSDCAGVASIELEAQCGQYGWHENDCLNACGSAGYSFVSFKNEKCKCYHEDACYTTFESDTTVYSIAENAVCPSIQATYTQCVEPANNVVCSNDKAISGGATIAEAYKSFLDPITCATHCQSQGYDFATVFRDPGIVDTACACIYSANCNKLKAYTDAVTLALGDNKCP